MSEGAGRVRTLFGSTGLLGSAFAAACPPETVRPGRADFDVADFVQIRAQLCKGRGEYVVNCLADTAVDAAQTRQDHAFLLNAAFPSRLAEACRELGLRLVHFSSTGCYGEHAGAAGDDAPLRPTTVHHASKAAGEYLVRRRLPGTHLILRTGWLFGGWIANPRDFVWARLVQAASAGLGCLTSDPFQRGCPTDVTNVVDQTLLLLERGISGTFNVVSSPGTSRFHYVQAVVKASGLPCLVVAADAPFRRAAPVSLNEVAVNARLLHAGLDLMPDWRRPVDGHVSRILASAEWRKELEARGRPDV